MARLIQINTPRSDSERVAQGVLATSLPDSWLLTTNIKERNFSGRRKPEIDSIVLSPLGVFILDFKNSRGHVTPMTNRVWGGLEENLFEQADDNVFPVKDLMRSQAGEVFVSSIIVFTHEDVLIDWQLSDVVDNQKLRVTYVRDVEARIRDIAGNRRKLDPYTARKALEALKPADIPDEVFRHTDWLSASPSDQISSHQGDPSIEDESTRKLFAAIDESASLDNELLRLGLSTEGEIAESARAAFELKRTVKLSDGWNAIYRQVEAGKLSQAEQSARNLIKAFPEAWEGWHALGGVYREKADNRQASACFRKAISIIQTNPEEMTEHTPALIASVRKIIDELDH